MEKSGIAVSFQKTLKFGIVQKQRVLVKKLKKDKKAKRVSVIYNNDMDGIVVILERT